MEDETEPSITIPAPNDGRLGYLHNANIHSPFVLEGKRWSTVEHFMLAKCFEGTILEEKIRVAKNVYKARILAKPRRIMFEENGMVYKKIIYGGKNKNDPTLESSWCDIRGDWDVVKDEYLKKALRAKFLQNKKALEKLLRTEGMRIIDPGKGIKFASVLEKVRDEILEERESSTKEKGKAPVKKFAAPYADMRSPFLSSDEIFFVKSFLAAVNILKEIENLPSDTKITLEMFEDIFYNFLDCLGSTDSFEEGKELLQIIKNWAGEHSAMWTDVTRNMPNYESVMREIESIVKSTTSSTLASTRVKISIFTATIIRWLRMDATIEEKSAFITKAKIIKKENFVLPPLRRSYRVNITLPPGETLKNGEPKKNVEAKKPQALPMEYKYALRGARYIELFRKAHNLDSRSFSAVVSYLEKMSRQERKGWLKNFEKLDVLQQKEELRNILEKVKTAKEDV